MDGSVVNLSRVCEANSKVKNDTDALLKNYRGTSGKQIYLRSLPLGMEFFSEGDNATSFTQ
jgi:hypothetical protein